MIDPAHSTVNRRRCHSWRRQVLHRWCVSRRLTSCCDQLNFNRHCRARLPFDQDQRHLRLPGIEGIDFRLNNLPILHGLDKRLQLHDVGIAAAEEDQGFAKTLQSFAGRNGQRHILLCLTGHVDPGTAREFAHS